MYARPLVRYVDYALRTGATVIKVPRELWIRAGKDEIREVITLAKLNKVMIIFEDGPVYDFREKRK